MLGIYAFTALLQNCSENVLLLWSYPVLSVAMIACFTLNVWTANLAGALTILAAGALTILAIVIYTKKQHAN